MLSGKGFSINIPCGWRGAPWQWWRCRTISIVHNSAIHDIIVIIATIHRVFAGGGQCRLRTHHHGRFCGESAIHHRHDAHTGIDMMMVSAAMLAAAATADSRGGRPVLVRIHCDGLLPLLHSKQEDRVARFKYTAATPLHKFCQTSFNIHIRSYYFKSIPSFS